MVDPVMLVETGHTYEREAIMKWHVTIKKDEDTGVPFQTDPSTDVCLQ